MIVLADVEGGSRWFQDVLGLRSGHGGPDYEMLMDGETLVAQLHRWEAHEHPFLGDPALVSRGNGSVLWFATDEFEATLHRVTSHCAVVLDGPLDNPSSGLSEVWLSGPEGYVVVIAGPPGTGSTTT